jgi:hypothetical protein
MTIPPIFKFKNVKTRITGANTPQLIYGVIPYNGSGNSLDSGISVSSVTAVVLTVQISNMLTTNVNITCWVQNSSSSNWDTNLGRVLVKDYPLIAYNAFDPLSGNLTLSANDQLWVQCSSANASDVVVSLLEIANATAN